MPPAYVFVEFQISDPDGLEEYKALATGALAAHGGTYLARGGAHELLEGEGSPDRVTMLRFPNAEAARAWYDGPEYTAARAARADVATGRFILVEGLE